MSGHLSNRKLLNLQTSVHIFPHFLHCTNRLFMFKVCSFLTCKSFRNFLAIENSSLVIACQDCLPLHWFLFKAFLIDYYFYVQNLIERDSFYSSLESNSVKRNKFPVLFSTFLIGETLNNHQINLIMRIKYHIPLHHLDKKYFKLLL